MKKFKAQIEHDCGTLTLTVNASSKEEAIKTIMLTEGCPQWSIKTIKEI